MRVFGFILFCLMACSPLFAQLVVNNSNYNLHSETYFNPKFLRVNQIEKITGKVSIKKELQPITDLGNISQFVFDRKGNLIEKIESFTVNYQRKDTSSILFQYNDINQLISVTNQVNKGFDATAYNYDSAGNIIKKSFFRGSNISQYKYQLNQGKKYFVREESLIIEKQSNQFEKVTTLNSDGAPYLITEIEYNELSNIIKKTSRFVVTNKKKEITYSYNENGMLAEIVETSNLMSPLEIKYSYTYDNLGNVYEELKYKNGILVERRQFLYEDVSSLLTAELIKNEKTNEIKIIQFEYEFFDSVTKVDP